MDLFNRKQLKELKYQLNMTQISADAYKHAHEELQNAVLRSYEDINDYLKVLYLDAYVKYAEVKFKITNIKYNGGFLYIDLVSADNEICKFNGTLMEFISNFKKITKKEFNN